MPLVLVIVGGLVTLVTGVVQFRRFPFALRLVMAGAFKKSASGDGTITPFQALSTALASTVGNGNIGGVATAILIGGPRVNVTPSISQILATGWGERVNGTWVVAAVNVENSPV